MLIISRFRPKIQKARIVGLAVLLLIILTAHQAFALVNLLNRSLQLGSSVASAHTIHTFSFAFAEAINVGSIVFEYCTDPIDVIACVNPTGSDVSGAALSGQS